MTKKEITKKSSKASASKAGRKITKIKATQSPVSPKESLGTSVAGTQPTSKTKKGKVKSSILKSRVAQAYMDAIVSYDKYRKKINNTEGDDQITEAFERLFDSVKKGIPKLWLRELRGLCPYNLDSYRESLVAAEIIAAASGYPSEHLPENIKTCYVVEVMSSWWKLGGCDAQAHVQLFITLCVQMLDGFYEAYMGQEEPGIEDPLWALESIDLDRRLTKVRADMLAKIQAYDWTTESV